MSSRSLNEMQTAPSEKVVGFSRLWWVGLLVIVVATVVNVVLALVANALIPGLAAFLPLGAGPIGFWPASINGTKYHAKEFALLGS